MSACYAMRRYNLWKTLIAWICRQKTTYSTASGWWCQAYTRGWRYCGLFTFLDEQKALDMLPRDMSRQPWQYAHRRRLFIFRYTRAQLHGKVVYIGQLWSCTFRRFQQYFGKFSLLKCHLIEAPNCSNQQTKWVKWREKEMNENDIYNININDAHQQLQVRSFTSSPCISCITQPFFRQAANLLINSSSMESTPTFSKQAYSRWQWSSATLFSRTWDTVERRQSSADQRMISQTCFHMIDILQQTSYVSQQQC